MTIRIHNIEAAPGERTDRLVGKAAERVGAQASQVRQWRIARRSVDARGSGVRIVYSVDLTLDDEAEACALAAGSTLVDDAAGRPPDLRHGSEALAGRPVIVGCGPAGLMAAVRLAENGYRPVVIDRGRPVAQRVSDVNAFLSRGQLDPNSNLLYGAGGAGTFSDGKLRTRTHDPRIAEVLRRFVEAGAPEEIAYDARPHVGTDRLRAVVQTLCRHITSCGGDIMWDMMVQAIHVRDDAACGVRTSAGTVEAGAVIFAAGAYARDTFALLADAGVAMQAKPFQMGLRIEHPQELIDHAIYGRDAGHPALGPADYVLTAKGDCPVTSFCVCPGGVLLPAVAEGEALCTNGMSRHSRDSGLCNGALVATVLPTEFGDAPLAGLELQRRCERAAYLAGGGDFAAPAQTASDFLADRVRQVALRTTYPRGLHGARLDEFVPPNVAAAIRGALRVFERRIPGFAGDQALMIGPEARASCPVRLLRDIQTRESTSLRRFYPAGAGSGHAAGIMSSAVDGLRTAESLIERFAPPAS